MKTKTFFALIVAIISISGYVNASENINEVKVNSKTSQVTVFLTGAELRNKAEVTLKKGKNLVKFVGLSSKLEANSVVIDIEKKNVVILSVYSSNNFLTQAVENPKVKIITDSIERIEDQIAQLKGMLETYSQEKDLLYKNDAILGKEKGVPVAEIEKAADFFRNRSADIHNEMYQLSKKERKFAVILEKLNKQLKEINKEINPPSSEVSVLVLAGEQTSTSFELKYRLIDAGWAPKYDIRVDDVTKPVNLYYKANVFNNTGVDWENVKLKLSTADPLQGAQYPKLDQWSLNENNYGYQQTKSSQGKLSIDNLKSQNIQVDFKTIAVNELSAEFEIELPYTVPADSKPYLVDVKSKTLESKYEHLSIPKMDKDAFLVAKVVGWADMNLVSGEASIYYNGSYIGQSKLNIDEISDTLELSLGRDNRVAISRIKKSEVNDHQIIGNYEKEVFKYQIMVKNNRDIPLTIKVQDQVPVEDDSRVSIGFNELSGGIHNKHNGEIIWNLNLMPGELKEIKFEFSVKSPKGFAKKKRKFRTVACPSF